MRILYLEDEPKDAELVQESLEAEGFVCDLARSDTRAEFFASLQQGGFDLILADYSLPLFDGISALKIAQEMCPEVPFIFVSGTMGEDLAIEALKLGATDYVFKRRLSRIVPSVRRALREAEERTQRRRAEKALQRSEVYLAEAQKLSHTGSFGWNVSSREMDWSDETFRIFGFEQDSQPKLELILKRTHPADRARIQTVLDSVSWEGKDFDFEHRLLMADGSVKYIRVVGHSSARDESGDLELVGAVTDITASKLTEQTLRRSEAYLAETQRLSQTGSWAWKPDTGEIRYLSEECYRVLGFDPTEPPPRFEAFFQRIHPDDQAHCRERVEKATRKGEDFELDFRIVHPASGVRDIHAVCHPVLSSSDDLSECVSTVIDRYNRAQACRRGAPPTCGSCSSSNFGA